ncbi:hypothetical protein EKG38_06105 [Shewanella canadensis]|uniref:Uncharacterized protein n=1 Tax=Shewanella canadensis TaxID=271096 RepID=A0A3S0LPG4_9GAMM|nr:hypothetical protein [Shewanella canadensis]RTR40286.1 hypothetical protein EKG38_06105 [Shewanella canadensis]
MAKEEVGTENNPIRFVQENVKRPKLELNSTLTPNGLGVFDFGKYKDVEDEYNVFFSNLIFNPNFSLEEIRFASLVLKSMGLSNEQLFWVRNNEQFRAREFGQSGLLYFTPDEAQIIEPINLPAIINKHKLSFTQQEIIAMLNTLHDYYYITCTEIFEGNLAKNTKGFDYINNAVSLSDNAKFVHIRINHGMDEKYIVDKWIKPTKHK